MTKTTVIIGSNPYFVLITASIPRVGDTVNLKSGLNGSFRVTAVDTISSTQEGKLSWPHLLVKRVGKHKARKLVYSVGEVEI